MLDAFRTLGQSWLAKVLMLLIGLSFVLWGVSGYLSDSHGHQEVAKVDGEAISVGAFQQRLQQTKSSLETEYGKTGAAQIIHGPRFAREVLDSMINDLLLAHEAQKLGLQVSDTRLAQKVESIPAFADKGKFSRQKYDALLKANGMTPASFEAKVKEGLLLSQLQVLPMLVADASKTEAEQVWAWSQEYREVAVLNLPYQAFLPTTAPSPDAVKHYYDAHVDQFVLPASVKVQYVVFGPKDLRTPAPGTAPTSSTTSANDSAELAFANAEDRFKNLLFSSHDLSAVAHKFHLSVQESGVLEEGKVPRAGVFADPAAVQAAFNKEVLAGRNSGAVTLKNGDLLAMHLQHYTPVQHQPLSAVQDQVTKILEQEQAQKTVQALAKKLQTGPQTPNTVAVWAQQSGGAFHHFAALSRQGEPSLPAPLINAIFLAPAPQDGHPSVGQWGWPGGITLFAIEQVSPPNSALMNPQVDDRIRESLAEQRARLLTAAYFRSLREKAKVHVDEKALQQAAA